MIKCEARAGTRTRPAADKDPTTPSFPRPPPRKPFVSKCVRARPVHTILYLLPASDGVRYTRYT